jgi:hypothetical protein
MSPNSRLFALALLLALPLSSPDARGEQESGTAEPAVVGGNSVVSDKTEDLSSFEAWKKAVLREGMTDEQKVLAAWETTVKFRHHDVSPSEYLGLADAGTIDAFKLFNVYGYCNGSVAQSAFLQLVRQLGYEARKYTVNRWEAPEVRYGGAWHMFDPGLICYFRKPDGSVASLEDLVAALREWYARNPGMLGNDQKIKEFQKNPGFKNGPALLAACPTYDAQGNFPLNYFGWFTAMIIYDGSNKTPFLYEEAASQGFRMNLQLRKGERLIRNWGHQNLHVNADGGGKVECLGAKSGQGALYYTPAWGDLGNGRVGNGTHEYVVPLDDRAVRAAFLSSENVGLKVEDRLPGLLHAKDASRPATAVLRMAGGYVYLTGDLRFDAVMSGGSIGVSLSDSQGHSWKPVATVTSSGAQRIDLTPFVLRRYDYRLKVELKGKGTALDSLRITNDFQHSQRALPALGPGENKIVFSAGSREGTIAIEGAGPKFRGKQVTYEDLGAVLTNIDKGKAENGGPWIPLGATGDVTFPVETPGDLVRLRFGCGYKAGSPAEGWDLQVSFDDGKTFKTVDRAAGPTRLGSKWVTCPEIPRGTRKALVRYSATSRADLILWRYRIEADYQEPNAGFAPVQITYRWEENGQPRESVHVARSSSETYSITCAQKPLLKSLTLERLSR